jgi:hypothetical protein
LRKAAKWAVICTVQITAFFIDWAECTFGVDVRWAIKRLRLQNRLLKTGMILMSGLTYSPGAVKWGRPFEMRQPQVNG